MENTYTRYLELVESGEIDPTVSSFEDVSFRKIKNKINEDDFKENFEQMRKYKMAREVMISFSRIQKESPELSVSEVLKKSFEEWDL